MGGGGTLPEADIVWQDGTPAAADFGDIYFNPKDGLAETRHVFLAGTDLPRRWQGGRHVTVGELGFGTGLNFLATWQLWTKSKPASGHLHYVSVEARPLRLDHLSSAHALFPELKALARRLREAWPPRARGHHVIHLAADVTLHLLWGDAEAMLTQLEARIDTWFLDGFAPARNPDMWSPAIMEELARCAAPGARAATFSVAGEVRRGLSAAGFEVWKAPGFGRKREMLQARFEGRQGRISENRPWFAFPPSGGGAGTIAIVGAGISGLSCAAALRRHGIEALIFDAAPQVPGGASATPAGLVMPRVGAAPDGPARFYAAAHNFAAATYRRAGVLSTGGALHLSTDKHEEARLEKMAVTGLFDPARLAVLDPKQASERAGSALSLSALSFEDAGQIDVAEYLRQCAAGGPVHTRSAVTQLRRDGSEWLLIGINGETLTRAATVIVATAMGARDLLRDAELPMEARHGQITRARGAAPTLPISFGGYAAPADGGVWIGATHRAIDGMVDPGFDREADQTNMAGLARVLPLLANRLTIDGHWTGVRATTPDQLPLAGPLTSAQTCRAAFAPLAKGSQRGLPPAPYEPGLYVLAGLGSRGLVTAPLLGEAIAAQILGTPSPLERSARHIVHPSRFQIRAIKRGEAPA